MYQNRDYFRIWFSRTNKISDLEIEEYKINKPHPFVNSHPQDINIRGSHALSASWTPFETSIVRPTDKDAVHIREPSTPTIYNNMSLMLIQRIESETRIFIIQILVLYLP